MNTPNNNSEYSSPMIKGKNQNQQSNQTNSSQSSSIPNANIPSSMNFNVSVREHTPSNNRRNSGIVSEESKSNFSNVSNQNGKYTCRFEIQIENDKDFQVARRLIGAKVCLL